MVAARHTAEDTNGRPRVAVVYHMFPHYRRAVLHALAGSTRYTFTFHGSHDPVEGIPAFTGDSVSPVEPLRFRQVGTGGIFHGLWRIVFDRDVDVLILIGNPNYLQTWIAALLSRLLGKRVLFWAHGWLRQESGLKGWLRTCYYRLSDGVLVYADRARDIAVQAGFPGDKIFPIYNSLDWDAALPLFKALEAGDPDELRKQGGFRADLPLIICTARLTPVCRFDLLLEAAALMKNKGQPVQIVLIGDGPQRPYLEAQAKAADLNIVFTGSIYEEPILARLLYTADVTVSPGKVGLTAMHSMTYGTPVITHHDLDQQMPEVEAVIQGSTGAFFKEGSSADLARAIQDVLNWPQSRAETRAACRTMIAGRYTPAEQARLIEQALDAVTGATA